MERVKLPREVAEAIEHCRNDDFSNRLIIRLALDERGNTPLRDLLYYFADTQFDTLVSALYNGYEVEQTPEEKVREMFVDAVNEEEKREGQETALAGWWEGRRMAIIDTVNALGIKIEGVNA